MSLHTPMSLRHDILTHPNDIPAQLDILWVNKSGDITTRYIPQAAWGYRLHDILWVNDTHAVRYHHDILWVNNAPAISS